jgi:hypothetical protein
MRKSSRTRYYLERRDAEFEQKMTEVLCVYREVQVLKKAAAKSRKAIKRVASQRHSIRRPSPVSTRPLRGTTNTNVMAR